MPLHDLMESERLRQEIFFIEEEITLQRANIRNILERCLNLIRHPLRGREDRRRCLTFIDDEMWKTAGFSEQERLTMIQTILKEVRPNENP